MRVLHYGLGFPPYRTGGLTKFCIDIMQQQKLDGHEVALLWPGQMCLIDRAVHINERKSQDGIQSFEVINPLPISYDEGIIEVEAFVKRTNKKPFVEFLGRYMPDVIHVQTLMGLHKEFLEVAKELNIRLVFTVHDFFTICPKVTMFRDNKVCEYVESCSMCSKCNLTALSMKKVFLLQSPMYRALKDSKLVRKLRKGHRDQYLSGQFSAQAESNVTIRTQDDYKTLRNYYASMIDLFDVVHANSNLTRDVFLKVYRPKDSKVISLSHRDIKDNRRRKQFSAEKLRITYLGPAGEGKGFYLLKEALDKLWKEDKSFWLNIFFEPTEASPYMVPHERYNYGDLDKIFEDTDVLVAPSIWYETFGYTVLEAMSYGVPVIVSSNVGAKDIIIDGCGIIIQDIDSEKLYESIKGLSVEGLRAMNECIIGKAKIMTLKEMSWEIMKQCY